MAAPWIDISVPVHPAMPVWPGDPAASLTRLCDLALGHECTLTRIDMCAHAGTHLDAPAHYIADGDTLDRMPLAAVMGRARVIAIEDPAAVTAHELARHRIRPGQRLLLKTANSARWRARPAYLPDFVHITPEAAEFLARRKVRLVGIDALSVGAPGESGTKTHLALLEAGVWILEGLDLSDAPTGPVQLACLPLKLLGTEGAPARAVVRPVKRRGSPVA